MKIQLRVFTETYLKILNFFFEGESFINNLLWWKYLFWIVLTLTIGLWICLHNQSPSISKWKGIFLSQNLDREGALLLRSLNINNWDAANWPKSTNKLNIIKRLLIKVLFKKLFWDMSLKDWMNEKLLIFNEANNTSTRWRIRFLRIIFF